MPPDPQGPGLPHHDVLIVGGGQAGGQVAALLRQFGYAGSIGLIGEEPDPPYGRPPLSKAYLSGEKTFDRLALHPPTFWSERAIDLRLNARVQAIDAASHAVTLSDGQGLSYRHLVWAAGGRPRRLACPGGGLGGVHGLRTRGDVDRIRGELETVERVLIVGGGYVGLEVAAVLTTLGKAVVLIEAQDRVLARVAGPEVSGFFLEAHRARGVDVRLGVVLDHVEGRDGHVERAHLSDGTIVDCRMIIVGIGIDPNVEPLILAGAEAANGVVVDAYCRTGLPDVFAIGDCAAHPNPHGPGGLIRLESVQNANDQAQVVARHLTGQAQPYDAVPWFWSQQYDLNLQTVGLSAGHDRTVVRGDPAARTFSVLYLRGGRVIALDCINRAKDYVQGRALIQSGVVADPQRLSDVSVTLKDIATSDTAFLQPQTG